MIPYFLVSLLWNLYAVMGVGKSIKSFDDVAGELKFECVCACGIKIIILHRFSIVFFDELLNID